MENSILFCSKCGSILDLSQQEGSPKCQFCGHKVNISLFPKKTTEVKLETIFDKTAKLEERRAEVFTKVDEACPKCGNPEMMYYTMQLRSADEGQTVFYKV